jgi:hypothetical protein
MTGKPLSERDKAVNSFLTALAADCLDSQEVKWRKGLSWPLVQKTIVGRSLLPTQFSTETPVLKVVVSKSLLNHFRVRVVADHEWVINPDTDRLHPVNRTLAGLLWARVADRLKTEPSELDDEIPRTTPTRLLELAKQLREVG